MTTLQDASHDAAGLPDQDELLLALFEVVRSEHREFGEAVEALCSFLIKRDPDSPVPNEYWDLYSQLAQTSGADSAGRLVFTEFQQDVMEVVGSFLRENALIVQLPDKESLLEKLTNVAKGWYFFAFLEHHFIPVIMEKAGEEFEVHSLVGLLEAAKANAFHELGKIPDHISDKAAIAATVLDVEMELVDILIENPYTAQYARRLLESGFFHPPQ